MIRKEKRRDAATGTVYMRWTVDVTARRPDGSKLRVRKDPSRQTRESAERCERDLYKQIENGTYGKESLKPRVVPTLAQFEDRFISEYCESNRHKPSGIDAKRGAFKNWLVPLFGQRNLDSFTVVDEDRLKKSMRGVEPSTYNNVASTLNSALRTAERWKVVQMIPHRFGLLKRRKRSMPFYDFDAYEKLLAAAKAVHPRALAVALLGGDAGLRLGEMAALRWTNVDLGTRQIAVEAATWRGKENGTKGMNLRYVPMTDDLREALATLPRTGQRVLWADRAQTVTKKVIQGWMARARRKAGLTGRGIVHILRHTFCSHLATRGAPALAIQHLAGHEDLATTMAYMHLAPGEKDRAIRLLDQGRGRVKDASMKPDDAAE